MTFGLTYIVAISLIVYGSLLRLDISYSSCSDTDSFYYYSILADYESLLS